MNKKRVEWLMGVLLLLAMSALLRQSVHAVNTKEDAPVIVIDAGHGGEDPGMIGADGLEEKGINLSVAKQLKTVLEERGWRIVLTRETDAGLYEETTRNKKAQDMQRRCRKIAEQKPVLTVSIHQNSYPDSSVKGPQVFYYQTSEKGKRLAECLQQSLNERLDVERPRQAKGNTSYYLLKRSEGVLNIVECGFLTNREEAALLQTQEYQKRLAEALAEGIKRYLSGNDAAEKESEE